MQQNSLLVNKAQQFCKEHHVHLLYLTLFGSKLYGTDMPGTSDLDVRGIFLPSLEKAVLDEIPHSLHWSSGNSASRNSADDLDMDLWSVQHWLLKLLPAGDMGATDLLFSPSNSNCTLYRDCRLDTVFAFPTKLYDTKGCRAYADYSLKQAKKYGIRGTRLGALRSVYIWITSSFPEISPDLRIKDVLHDLIALPFSTRVNQPCNFVEKSMRGLSGSGSFRSVSLPI